MAFKTHSGCYPSCPVRLRTVSICILTSTTRSSKGHLSFKGLHQTLYTVFFFLRMHALNTTFLVLQVLVALIIGKELKKLNSSLCSFLQSAVTSALLGPNILISAPFFNACSLFSSINVRTSFTRLRITA